MIDLTQRQSDVDVEVSWVGADGIKNISRFKQGGAGAVMVDSKTLDGLEGRAGVFGMLWGSETEFGAVMISLMRRHMQVYGPASLRAAVQVAISLHGVSDAELEERGRRLPRG